MIAGKYKDSTFGTFFTNNLARLTGSSIQFCVDSMHHEWVKTILWKICQQSSAVVEPWLLVNKVRLI